jgi:hypothetical protein
MKAGDSALEQLNAFAVDLDLQGGETGYVADRLCKVS